MGFASAWLKDRALFPEFISDRPSDITGIIVVIPAYNEPGIKTVLDSLSLCSEPDCKVEVIIVVNAPAAALAEHHDNNRLTIQNIESWKIENRNSFFRLFAFTADPILPGWGVGMARKAGMDEALRRFDAIGNPEGVILCLDADCTVSGSYFVSVCNELLKRKDRSACSIRFEHALSGDEFLPERYTDIGLYELHLRYLYQGMIYAGFPYVFHTIGSAMAVKAGIYAKAGGMNRRQAGEDFYFIQKLVPSGGYFSLNSATVFPSPRTSFRVPFGTGAAMEKLSKDTGSPLLTYNFKAFDDLKSAFSGIADVYSWECSDFQGTYSLLPESLKLFFKEEEWTEKMSEIKNNTSSFTSFRKRFFDWFNMFRIIKYLNFVHQSHFEKKPVVVSAIDLLKHKGIDIKSSNAAELLPVYRSLELS
jgi:glycosyltransferase involved in cell wall biosynthesis